MRWTARSSGRPTRTWPPSTPASQRAAAALADKIMKGGTGVWGPVPMPANPKVSPAEARRLAQWVLSQK